MGISLVQPLSPEDWGHARALIEQYTASLGVDLSFQNLAHELEHLPSEYAPPAGAFLLARENHSGEPGIRYLGCVGLRRRAERVAEIKRLYTAPAGRGRRLGRLLAESIIAAATNLGYRQLVLDTLPSMREAHSLYTSLGFKPIAPYRFNPVPGTVYLELRL